MKKRICFLFFTVVLAFSQPAMGQRDVVVVEPDAGLEIGALNDAIETCADPGNTIFELRRNGVYLLNGTIAHSGYRLIIRTEDGPGSKAVIQPGVDETGTSEKQFSPSGDLILQRVYILGRDELGASANQPINVLADSCRIEIDDCVMDYSAQSFVRTGSKYNTIVLKNSILRNSVRPDGPANGRIIDTRGNRNDTLWISNCTIYNNTATQLRSDGAAIIFANFDHNTVFQTSLNHNMALDYMYTVNITNNLFYNYLYRGNNKEHDPMFRCDSLTVNHEKNYGYDNANRYFDLSNNNWYVEDTIGAILDEYGPDSLYTFYDNIDPNHTDTIWYREELRTQWFANEELMALDPESTPDLVKFIQNGQVDTSGLFREELTFENPPPLNLDYWKFYCENDFSIQGMDTPSPWADENPLVLGEVQEGAFDFAYNTDSRSYTAADGERPLGANRWWPQYVSVPEKEIRLASGIRTYPNPFDDQVTFNFDATGNSHMTIRIFDLMGRELYTEFETVNQGKNDFTVNLRDISHSGILLYQIEFENNKGLKSTSSGKIIKR